MPEWAFAWWLVPNISKSQMKRNGRNRLGFLQKVVLIVHQCLSMILLFRNKPNNRQQKSERKYIPFKHSSIVNNQLKLTYISPSAYTLFFACVIGCLSPDLTFRFYVPVRKWVVYLSVCILFLCGAFKQISIKRATTRKRLLFVCNDKL